MQPNASIHPVRDVVAVLTPPPGPEKSKQDMVQRVLQLATEESDDPDLRDRGFVYWRLLSTNPEAAKAVVLSEKPNIADDTFTLEPAVLDMLIGQVDVACFVSELLCVHGGEGLALLCCTRLFCV